MENLTSNETLRAKKAFERHASSFTVSIKHYHCDNGSVFRGHAFVADCEMKSQGISYCGVYAHHQNGLAEKAIRDLQDSARKQLLFAQARWSEAIDTSLWPYALLSAAAISNNVPQYPKGEEDLRSSFQLFTGVNVYHHFRFFHTFGAPAYKLHTSLQAGGKIPKWDPRCSVGINLGPSPHHARNVYLILDTTTGLCSPHYHVTVDDFFQSVRDSTITGCHHRWKIAARLTERPAPTQVRGREALETHPDFLAMVPNPVEPPVQDVLMQDILRNTKPTGIECPDCGMLVPDLLGGFEHDCRGHREASVVNDHPMSVEGVQPSIVTPHATRGPTNTVTNYVVDSVPDTFRGAT
jgi:hypothetical protein